MTRWTDRYREPSRHVGMAYTACLAFGIGFWLIAAGFLAMCAGGR